MNWKTHLPLILSVLALGLAAFSHHDANLRVDDVEARLKELREDMDGHHHSSPRHPPIRIQGECTH